MNTNHRIEPDAADAFLRELEAGDWLPLNEVCRIVKSPRTGKRLSLCTATRWCLTGKLPAMRQGRYWYVHKRDLAALFRPHVVATHEPTRRMRERERREDEERNRRTDEILKRHGVR